jgi:protein-tyrosine phosphatase
MDSPAASISIPSVPNLRDVGGVATRDGRRVRAWLLYRSGALYALEGADVAAFAGLGIRTIYDLRSDREREVRPDRVPEGIEYVPLDMIADVVDHTPGRIMASLHDPVTAHETFGEGRAAEMFLAHYREFVSLPSARRALALFFGDLAGGQGLPSLVHCMGGKDRTGWTAAAFQALLGVPDDVVMAQFMASNDHLSISTTGFVKEFEARGGDPQLIADFLMSRPVYLDAAFDEMRGSFGTIERYFGEGLGLGSDGIEELRSRFLED